MATFENRTVSSTYKGLLNIDNSNAGVDGTVRTVQDGEGTSSALQLSSTTVNVNGTFKVGNFTVTVPAAVTFGGAFTTANAFTTSGNFALTLTTTNTTNVTLPTTGTLATLAGSETLTNKTLTSPTLTTPVLGTPSSGTLTNCTGLPITGLASGTSANLASVISDETGSGALVFATSPTLVTPVLGAATYTTLAGGAINTTGTITHTAVGNMNFQVSGGGVYVFKATSSVQTALVFEEDTDNGSNYIQIQAPASITSNRVLTWKDTMDGYPVLDTVASDAWTDFSGTISYGGFSGTPTTNLAKYKKLGNTCFVMIDMSGTSNATTFTITLPFNSNSGSTINLARVTNNSTTSTAPQYGTLSAASAILTLTLGDSSSAWTSSGTKGCRLSFFYETA